MSITVDASPISTHSTKKIIYSNQTAVWSLSTSLTVTSDFRFVVEIRENTTGGTLLAKYYLPANPQNKLHFNFNDTAKALVEHQIFNEDGNLLVDGNNFESTLIAHSGDVGPRRIFILFGEYNDSGGEVASSANQDFLLIPGARQDTEGLHPVPFGCLDSNFFAGATDGGWLSARLPSSADPNVLTLRWDIDKDHIVLPYINDNVLVTAQFNLQDVRFRMMNGTSVVETVIKTLTSNGGAAQNSSSDYNKKIEYIQLNKSKLQSIFTTDLDTATYTNIRVFLRNDSNNSLTECDLVNHCYSKKVEHVQMAFTNFKGGYDYLWFNLRTQKEVNVQRKMYSRISGSYGDTTFTLDTSGGETRPYYVEGNELYSLQMETAFLEEQQLLQHALRAKSVFIRVAEGWIPVTIETSSIRAETESRTGLYRATLDVKRANTIKC